jgi:DNA-binding CsgD family transcriptional regulator/tetratricopeptide (TPR) repeat protein
MNEPGNLFGRERELAAVGELLDGAASRGAALLVRGRPGAGRSSLLAAVAAAASSRRIKTVAVTGTRLEAGLPFAGLHQLVQPFMDGIDDLPAPQRDAVLTAFGMSPGTDPNLLFVALGGLQLLASAAAGDPLVLLADDAQWLDVASSEVLAIIAQRLEPTALVLIAAARAGYHTPLTRAGLAELDLPPLAPGAARTLLEASAGPLASAEREQVLADAGGNPLALVELSGTFVSVGRAACTGTLPTLPALTSRLEQAFTTCDHELPAVTRTLLLIAAASDGDDLTEVLAAGAAAGLRHASAEALVPAAAADLIHITGSVFRFPHLLARSAVYYEAALPDRHAAHAALAGVLADQPERAAWHAAATVTDPDETAATEMELAARRALSAGGVVAALAATERAVTLTADPARRGGRLLRAAELSHDVGRIEAARRLMAQARPLRLGSTDRTRLAWLDQVTSPGGPNDAASLRRLTGLAGQASQDRDHDLALSILDTAALACLEAGHDENTRQLVVAAIEATPALSGRPQRLAALAVADPDGQGASIIAAVSGLRQSAGRDLTDADDVLAAGVAATIAGDPETGAAFLAGAITPLRAQGRLRLLAGGLVVQAWGATCRSDWDVAIPAAAEGIRLAQETEQPVFVTMGLCSQLTLAALRADVDAARSLMRHAERQLAPGQGGYALAVMQTAGGLSALGAGRYEEAYEQLRHIFTPGDPACHYLQRGWAIADLAEAATHSGHREQARAYVSDVARTAGRTPSPFLRAGLAYARLMLVSDEEAEQRFESAANVELACWPFLRARAELGYGAWLRRQRRITESRRPLRAACAAFEALGADPWAGRARQELRAAGEAAFGARLGEGGVLSPQELQIAEMAASGMSNREIGQHLYLSHRTVATHLYRIFPKLGITSRFQMPQALRALSGVQ